MESHRGAYMVVMVIVMSRKTKRKHIQNKKEDCNKSWGRGYLKDIIWYVEKNEKNQPICKESKRTSLHMRSVTGR